MDRIKINARGFCEVARAVTSEKSKDGIYKRIKVTRLYRSDGSILEKYETHRRDPLNDVADWNLPDRKFSFGWQILGKTKKSPKQWVANYKDNWKITRRSENFMSKYISKKEIKRLKDGL